MILELRQLYLEVILLLEVVYGMLNSRTWRLLILMSRLKVFLLTSVNRPDFAFEPTTAPNLWDPTASPDFINFIGKPYKTWETVLEQGNSWQIGGRLKLQKVDQITYREQGRTPILVCLFTNVGTSLATNIHVTRSYNLSFAGDTQ